MRFHCRTREERRVERLARKKARLEAKARRRTGERVVFPLLPLHLDGTCYWLERVRVKEDWVVIPKYAAMSFETYPFDEVVGYWLEMVDRGKG